MSRQDDQSGNEVRHVWDGAAWLAVSSLTTACDDQGLDPSPTPDQPVSTQCVRHDATVVSESPQEVELQPEYKIEHGLQYQDMTYPFDDNQPDFTVTMSRSPHGSAAV